MIVVLLFIRVDVDLLGKDDEFGNCRIKKFWFPEIFRLNKETTKKI